MINIIIFQPFDSHHCDFDFGNVISNTSVIFAPVQILPPKGGVNPVILTKDIRIPNFHLPYSFTMSSKKEFVKPEIGYYYTYTGIVINIKRQKLDQLMGGFFGPMTIFALLSMISFFIKPEVVSFFFKKFLNRQGSFSITISFKRYQEEWAY